MKLSNTKYVVLLIICGGVFFYQSCKKKEDPVKYKYGLFLETLINIYDMDNKLDNSDLSEYVIHGNIAILFSNSGDQYGLEQGEINYIFDQTTGELRSSFGITNDVFTQNLINKAAAQGNNSAPYRFFCTTDGFEYFMFSAENTNGNSDFFYMKNTPMIGASYPEIRGPFPVALLNTTANDSYISFNQNFDTAYFSSDRDGTFNVYVQSFLPETSLSDQLNKTFVTSAKPDSINSNGNDICPFVHKNVMVFASDRLGGLGGFDLYYSVFRNGKWSSPVNFGPGINTEYDEYMPVIGSVTDFKNSYLIFSSNRKSEGKDEFELYFTGFNLPK